MANFESFVKYVESQTGVANLAQALSPKTISPDIITLPVNVLQTVKRFVELTFQLRQNTSYQKYVHSLSPGIAHFDPQNFSALMSYDFHLDARGLPRLVEINTNAAFSLILWHLFQFHKVDSLTSFADEILTTFKNEYTLAKSTDLKNVLIVDENPVEQKLYAEFLLFQKLFQDVGVNCEICDSGKLAGKKDTLVYNRDTDFYLQTPRLKDLHDGYSNGELVVSPNPHEYALLADKDRMLDFSNAERLESYGLTSEEARFVASVVLKTSQIKDYTPDELWSARKGLFFKPRRSFGAKAVYRGNSISRGMFERILEGDYLAQEFVTPPEIEVKRGDTTDRFKYDLRFYVYRDTVQLVGARLFKGQVTNFTEDGGGFAPVLFG